MLKFLLLSTLLFSFSSFKDVKVQSDETKIKGINFVSPTKKVSANCVISTKRINANWIALYPYAFMSPNNPNVEYNVPKNWWGDKPEGICKLTAYTMSKSQKLKNIKLHSIRK